MKEISVTSKKLHLLSTPIKVSFEVCSKIWSHDGLQIFYNISFGWHRSQGFPEREQSDRNFLLTSLNFLRTINLLLSNNRSIIIQTVNYPVELSYQYTRMCTYLPVPKTGNVLFFTLFFTLSKVNSQDKVKLHQLPTPFKVNFEVCVKWSQK